MQAAHTRGLQAEEVTVTSAEAISKLPKPAVFLETQQPLSHNSNLGWRTCI